MNLQKKTLIVFILLLCAVLAALSIFISGITLSSYSTLERQYIDRELDQAQKMLADEIRTLETLTSDWGPWDDTYDFVLGTKPDYVQTNLLPETYQSLHLDLVVITDRDGNPVYAGLYDEETGNVGNVPDGVLRHLSPGLPLMTMSDPRQATSGILTGSSFPLLVSSWPVTHSDFSAEPVGVILMGRYLDPEEVGRLANMTYPSLAISPISGSSLSSDQIGKVREMADIQAPFIETVGEDRIAGYDLVRDIYGNAALVLSVTESRDIYNEGLSTALQFIFIILAWGLLLGLVVVILIDRWVLSRVEDLRSRVHSIACSRDFSQRVAMSGEDEFTTLSSEVDSMLEKIEQSNTDLAASEARFRELSDLLPQIVFEMDTDFRVTYANQFAVTTLGLMQEDLDQGVSGLSFLDPAEHGRARKALEDLVEGKSNEQSEFIARRKDGTPFPALIYAAPVLRAGKIAGFRGVVIDITALKKAENALRESEDRLNLAIDGADLGLWDVDLVQGTMFHNRQWFEMLGYPAEKEECPLSWWQEKVTGEDIQRITKNIEECVAQGTLQYESEYRIKHRDGSWRWMHMKGQVVSTDSRGQPVRIIGISQDITRRREAEEALRNSEADYRGVIEDLQDVFYRADTAGNIVMVSPSVTEMFGYDSAREVIGLNLTRDVYADPENRMAFLKALKKTGSVKNFEAILKKKDGSPIIVSTSAHYYRDADGTVLGVEGIAKDITEWEHAQEALRESEEQYRALAENIADVIYSFDNRGMFTYISPLVERYGYSPDELIGKPFALFIHPEDRDEIIANYQRAIAEGVSKLQTFRILDKDGHIHWFEGKNTLKTDSSGNHVGVFGILRDVTDRLQIEDALAKSEEQYRALAENIADVIFSLDNRGMFTYISPLVEQYGYTPDEILGKPFTQFIHPDDRQRIVANYQREIAEGMSIPSRFRILDKEGGMWWLEENSSITVDPSGNPTGLYGILRDVTERKRAEDAIELANKKLNLMNNITRHDILNTLTGLFGFVDMAAVAESPEERTAFLGRVKELAKTIQRQITFTREYQEVGIHLPRWQNLNGLMNRVVQNFRNSGITIDTNLPDIDIYADPMLEKAIYNLIDNAIRHGDTISRIRFSSDSLGNGFSLICEDDGVGIPEDRKKFIFERGIGKNSGMGLFLTSEILGITGISIQENGMPGQGARFEILVPPGTYRFISGTAKRS